LKNPCTISAFHCCSCFEQYPWRKTEGVGVLLVTKNLLQVYSWCQHSGSSETASGDRLLGCIFQNGAIYHFLFGAFPYSSHHYLIFFHPYLHENFMRELFSLWKTLI
jgi:hypothetical protein